MHSTIVSVIVAAFYVNLGNKLAAHCRSYWYSWPGRDTLRGNQNSPLEITPVSVALHHAQRTAEGQSVATSAAVMTCVTGCWSAGQMNVSHRACKGLAGAWLEPSN